MSEQAPSSSTVSMTPSPRARTNCLARALSALLLIVLSVALAIAGVGALAFYVFGYTPETPTLAARAQSDLQSLSQQNSVLQTQVTDLTTRSDSSRELLQDLDRQVRDLSNLSSQMRTYNGVAATIQVESRDSRTAVAAYASSMATRIAQIDELQRRTDRLGRFLQRLSDISNDTATDLSESTAVAPSPPASSPPASSPPASSPPASSPASPPASASTPSPTASLLPSSTPALASPTIIRTAVEPTVPTTSISTPTAKSPTATP